ncbi:cdk-activating kinase assembly factor mat1 [Anaeramoeba ignava]|uniref:Cdk-activating kinase assembly factor mat1 n=1 Tax=Anaeramoeba ignava TaxID=1746090 RepID=A0A9Q0LPI5_ANAIG|nr:cdk-activating kinase assembly factor mat1 [Anaeramoeba ignava]
MNETKIRRDLFKTFNKTKDNFSNLREYNDYLEELEEIIYQKTNAIEPEELNKKIANYRKENEKIIIENEKKQILEKQKVKKKREEEKEKVNRNREEMKRQEEEIKNKRRQRRNQQAQAIINTKIHSKKPKEKEPKKFDYKPQNLVPKEHQEIPKKNLVTLNTGMDKQEQNEKQTEESILASGFQFQYVEQRSINEAFNFLGFSFKN